MAVRLRELVRQTCERSEVEILDGVVSSDHVHILVSAPPQLAPSEIMRRVKGRPAEKSFEDSGWSRKEFWGRRLWARGYFCVTSGAKGDVPSPTQEKIEEYLRHHFEPTEADNFKIE